MRPDVDGSVVRHPSPTIPAIGVPQREPFDGDAGRAERAGQRARVVEHVKNGKGGEGYNVATGKFEDLIASGVVDPTKVIRSALQNAASISGLLLTTECLVADLPEDEPGIAHMVPDVIKKCLALPEGARRGGRGSEACGGEDPHLVAVRLDPPDRRLPQVARAAVRARTEQRHRRRVGDGDAAPAACCAARDWWRQRRP